MKFFFSNIERQGRARSTSGQAFSLIEIVLALGIATFCIISIISLLQVGIQSTKDSLEESQAVNVLSEVIADRQATPLNLPSTVYNLPALTNSLTTTVTNFFGLTDDNRIVTQLSDARYRVDYAAIPPTSGRLDPYKITFKVSWPAPSTNAAGFVEGVVSFPQE